MNFFSFLEWGHKVRCWDEIRMKCRNGYFIIKFLKIQKRIYLYFLSQNVGQIIILFLAYPTLFSAAFTIAIHSPLVS